MNGNWKLVGPDGQEFVGVPPLRCCQKEIDSRVPKEIQTKRLLDMMSKCSLCEDGHPKYTIGKNTPAEIPGICETCFKTIWDDCKTLMEGGNGAI